MKNTSFIDPSRSGIVTNIQGAYVSKNQAYALAQTVEAMFAANGIKCEIEQSICKERSPEASVEVGTTGIKVKLGFTCKTTTKTRLTPRGGIFDD